MPNFFDRFKKKDKYQKLTDESGKKIKKIEKQIKQFKEEKPNQPPPIPPRQTAQPQPRGSKQKLPDYFVSGEEMEKIRKSANQNLPGSSQSFSGTVSRATVQSSKYNLSQGAFNTKDYSKGAFSK